MEISLRQCSVDMGKKEYDMLQTILSVDNGFNNPAYGLSYPDYQEWLCKEDGYSKGKNLLAYWSPVTTYFLYIDEVPVGYGRIRHCSSEYLEKVLGVGNLGYGISKNQRGKRYGNILFSELLKKCRDFGYKKIRLYPYKKNEATLKIMLKNGGKIVGEFQKEKYIVELIVPDR